MHKYSRDPAATQVIQPILGGCIASQSGSCRTCECGCTTGEPVRAKGWLGGGADPFQQDHGWSQGVTGFDPGRRIILQVGRKGVVSAFGVYILPCGRRAMLTVLFLGTRCTSSRLAMTSLSLRPTFQNRAVTLSPTRALLALCLQFLRFRHPSSG